MMKVLAVMTYFQISLPTHNWDSANKNPASSGRGFFCIGCLAVSYSHGECHTTIGATAFHVLSSAWGQVVPLRLIAARQNLQSEKS